MLAPNTVWEEARAMPLPAQLDLLERLALALGYRVVANHVTTTPVKHPGASPVPPFRKRTK